MTDSPRDIRRRIRRARLALTDAERRRAAGRFAERVRRLAPYRRARRIGAYLAHGGELDPAPLMDLAEKDGKKLYLPVVDGAGMRFARYRAHGRLRPNRFAIPEPAAPRRLVRTMDLDIAIVPLVAFDARAHRLGQGGGYYDRHFARQTVRHWRRPLLIGAAYELQRHDPLPTNDWDVAMWCVVTERAVYRGGRRGTKA